MQSVLFTAPADWAIHRLNVKTVLFRVIQLSINTHFKWKKPTKLTKPGFCFVWPIYRTSLGATTLGQSGPRSDSNEGVLSIPQLSSLTGTSSSDCLASYQDTHLWRFTPQERCSRCIQQPQLTDQMKSWIRLFMFHYALIPLKMYESFCSLPPAQLYIFVAASDQTGLYTRSMTRRSIIVGI